MIIKGSFVAVGIGIVLSLISVISIGIYIKYIIVARFPRLLQKSKKRRFGARLFLIVLCMH